MKNAIHFMMTGICALAAGGGCVLDDSEPAAAGGIPPLLQPTIIVTNGTQINGPLINGGAAAGTEVDGDGVAGTTAGGSALLRKALDQFEALGRVEDAERVRGLV